jgi:hypothetical protein
MIHYRGRDIELKEFDICEINDYVDAISKSNKYLNDIQAFSMPNNLHKYGLSLSSGTLYKWDTGDIFIKASDIDYLALNESYIYSTFQGLGVETANAFPVIVSFVDDDFKQKTLTGCISIKFKGNLVYYREIRKSFGRGLLDVDEFVQFCNGYPDCIQGFIDMCAVDVLTHQDDRHSKNFGLIGGNLSPIYDNGASYGYNRLNIGVPHKAVFKAFGEPYTEIMNDVMRLSNKNITLDISKVIDRMIASNDLFEGLIKENKMAGMMKYAEEAVRCLE